MRIYDLVKECPKIAQKAISAGRLKGMTDINPMWRICELTKIFGPVGIGWYYDILKQWIEDGANGEKVALTNIALYIKDNGEWSKPIYGTGGSMLIANEKNGAHTSDECFKMALTDAISVCCKALGFGANVYWAAGRTKYSGHSEKATPKPPICAKCGKPIVDVTTADGTFYSVDTLCKKSLAKYGNIYCSKSCATNAKSEGENT